MVKSPQSRRLHRAAGAQRRDRAGQEARGAEPGVPVRPGQIEDRARSRHDVAGDGRDAEEDAAEQVDRGLPAVAAAAAAVGDHAGHEEADRAERVRPPDEPVVVGVGDRRVERHERGDVEEQRARRLDDAAACRSGPVPLSETCSAPPTVKKIEPTKNVIASASAPTSSA